MSVPEPIEPIHFDQPRAVQVREPENLKSLHSAVSGMMHVYVETRTEATQILDNWRIIMQAAADKANEILTEIRKSQEAPEPATDS